MNAAAPWTRVVLAPWQQRRNRGSKWLLGLQLAGIGASALACLVMLPSRVGAVVAVAMLSMPMFAGWVWLVRNLLQQNRSSAARLVPGQLTTLRRVLFGAWLMFMLFSALVGSGFGHPWSLAAGVGLLLLLLMWAVRVPTLNVLFGLVPALGVLWAHTPAMQAAVISYRAAEQGQLDGIALAALSALLAAALASPLVLLRAEAASRPAARHRCARPRVYQRWLERAVNQRSSAVLPRALLGLGPRLHWSGQLGQLPVLGAIGAVTMVIVWQIDPATSPLAAWGLSAGALTFAVDVALKARSVIYRRRGEQALMMLLPGMPRGRALNRALARRLSLQFLCSWALGVLVCALLLPLGERFGWFAIYAAACLPIGALLWTDWSRLQTPTAISAVVPMLAAMSLALAAMAAHVPAWICVLCFVAAAVLLVAWRARRLLGAPSAFPAGRLS